MPTFRVWIKKSVLGPAGPIEIGLGGTHEVDCSPAQVQSERLALYASYRDEVDRLLEAERSGLALQPIVPRSASRTTSFAPTPAPHKPPEPVRPATPPAESAREVASPDAASSSDAGWVTAERSRMFIAELQERIQRKLKAPSTPAPLPAPSESASGLEPAPEIEPTQTSILPSSPEHPPLELAALLLREDLS